MAYLLPTRRDSNKRNNPVIIGITTTLNEADGFQRVNVEYINRVAATGAVPILLTPIAGGAEANREHAATSSSWWTACSSPEAATCIRATTCPTRPRIAMHWASMILRPWAAAPPPTAAPQEQKFPSAAITYPTAPSKRPWMAPRPWKRWSPWTAATCCLPRDARPSPPGRFARRLRGSRRLRAGARPPRP